MSSYLTITESLSPDVTSKHASVPLASISQCTLSFGVLVSEIEHHFGSTGKTIAPMKIYKHSTAGIYIIGFHPYS